MRDINVLPTWVYYLHDSRDDWIYVGVTCDLLHRMHEHRVTKPWWGEVTAVLAFEYPDREQALTWEARDIRRWRPRYNREVPPQPVVPPQWDVLNDYIRGIEFFPEEVPWPVSAR